MYYKPAPNGLEQIMSYYDGDPFSGHELNEVKCAECEEYFDDQEREGNICPACIEKGESK
jgi:formylmethanofuran dehydrogenase subunit E